MPPAIDDLLNTHCKCVLRYLSEQETFYHLKQQIFPQGCKYGSDQYYHSAVCRSLLPTKMQNLNLQDFLWHLFGLHSAGSTFQNDPLYVSCSSGFWLNTNDESSGYQNFHHLDTLCVQLVLCFLRIDKLQVEGITCNLDKQMEKCTIFHPQDCHLSYTLFHHSHG